MSRRPALQAVLLALLLVLPHLLFLAVDQRPPNDHDTWYTKGVADSWTNAQLAPDAVGKVKAVAEHFLFEGWHPQLAQTLMLAAMVLLGPSLLVFRGINLLFWALLVGSTYAVGRQLRSHRLGLVAMTLVAWMPGMLAYARKWEPMFHGSAFSAFAWALALRCLAPDAARLRWPWLALGCALGARFYTHPTGLPDLGLTLALTPLFAFVLARRRGEALGPLLRRAAMLGGTTLALGAWYLGLLPVVAQEPSYKLEYYLGWRASYVGGGEGDLLQRQVQGLRKLSNALWHWHWHPVMALALGFPGLLAAGRQIARVPVTGAGLLGAIFLLQLPLVQITFANGAVTPDWLHLMPLAIILAAFGLSALVDVGGRLGQGGRALLVVSLGYAALSAVGPQVVSLAGPDPLLDSRAYRASILQPFQTIDTGDAAEAPHLLSRHVQAADRVAELMAAQATPEELHASALLEVRDLTLIRNGAGIDSPSCAVEPQAEVCCGFETKPRGGSRDRLQPVWPYRFAGWTSVDIDDDPARNARFVLVRLWHDQEVVGPLFEGQPHEPPESTQVSRCVQAAGQELAATFPNATVTSLADPPGRLISRMWAYRTEYAHRAFLVDRGEGVFTVDAEHQSPIGGPLPQ